MVQGNSEMVFEIERRDKLSYEEFAEEYLYPLKPVIVTDALRQWKALGLWTPEFFKREFGQMKFKMEDDLKARAGYKSGAGAVEYTMERFIDCVLESTEEHPAPYFRNRILSDLFPSLKDDILPLPEYFEPNWLPEHFLVKHVREVLNRGAAIEIYIGGTGGAFPVLHYDGAGTHAFLMQIYGRKEFIIYAPEQEEFLYPASERLNLSTVNDLNKPDLERFPLFARAVPSKFILEPGELLFIPSHWWHTTKMLTPCISVSANVLNESNWKELVRFVARGRRNPMISLASRLYLNCAGAWRSWRDREWRKRAQRAPA
jgi:histone arginine demethylase JMJD6